MNGLKAFYRVVYVHQLHGGQPCRAGNILKPYCIYDKQDMIMHVDVYSRRQMLQQVETDPSTCLISITTPTIGSPLLDPRYEHDVQSIGWFAVLRLQFHDAVTHHYHDMTLFDDSMAQRTVDFIRQHGHLDFVVHCDAGKSRSVAIGRFISETYGHTLTIHELQNAQVDHPKGNQLMVELLHKHSS